MTARLTLRSWPWRKLALIAVAVLVGVELVYVAAVNIMLRNGSLERLINSGSPDVQVKLEGGFSPWPGRVHLEQVRVRFQDRNLQFLVRLDDADVDLGVLALLARTIRLERVRGENTQYLFRHKVESPKGLETRLAHYPKIDGFPDPPVITGPPRPTLSDEEYDLWTVELEDADVQVRELWFQEYRFVGTGRARGGFRLQPQRSVETRPCSLELHGTLHGGPHLVARAFRGNLEAQLHRHDPREVSGLAVFGEFSLRTDLRGDVPGLEVTRLYTGDDLQIDRGAGSLRLDTRYVHGQWQEGSRVHFATEAARVRTGDATVAGAGELEARITRGGEDPRVELSAEVPSAMVGLREVPERVESPSVRGARLVLGATADLTEAMRWTSLSAETRAAMPDLRWLNTPIPAPGPFSDGALEARAKVQWNEGAPAAGEVEVEIERAEFFVSEQPAQVSGRLVLEGRRGAETGRGYSGDLSLQLPKVAVAGEPLPGGLSVRSEWLRWQGVPPERVDARLLLTSETLEPLVQLVIPSDILRALADALVHLGKTRAVVALERTPAFWTLALEEARSGDVEAFGQLRSERGLAHACGRWYVQDGSLRVGIVQVAGETSVEPLVSPAWWREQPVARCEAAAPKQGPSQRKRRSM